MRGRDVDFKCVYCGLFLPYDRRKVSVENNMYWDYNIEEPCEEFVMYHKKCKRKSINRPDSYKSE